MKFIHKETKLTEKGKQTLAELHRINMDRQSAQGIPEFLGYITTDDNESKILSKDSPLVSSNSFGQSSNPEHRLADFDSSAIQARIDTILAIQNVSFSVSLLYWGGKLTNLVYQDKYPENLQISQEVLDEFNSDPRNSVVIFVYNESGESILSTNSSDLSYSSDGSWTVSNFLKFIQEFKVRFAEQL